MIPRSLSEFPQAPHSAHAASSAFWWCSRVPAMGRTSMGSGEPVQGGHIRAFQFLEACADLRQESNLFSVVMPS